MPTARGDERNQNDAAVGDIFQSRLAQFRDLRGIENHGAVADLRAGILVVPEIDLRKLPPALLEALALFRCHSAGARERGHMVLARKKQRRTAEAASAGDSV